MDILVIMCDNCNTCQRELGTTVSVNGRLDCRMCGAVAYCGADCAKTDLLAHAAECGNIHQAASLKAAIAMPYVYQDVLRDSTELKQSHLVQHHSSSGLVSARIAAFEEPSLVAASLLPARYSIRVNDAAVTAIGNGKTDLIEARAPGKHGKLASTRLPTTGKNAWLPLSAPVAFTPGEPFTVSLYDETEKRAVASCLIQMPATEQDHPIDTLSRKERAPVLGQLQDKRAATGKPYVAQNESSTVRMIVDATGEIADIEYELAGAPVPEWSTTQFKCDGRDIDQVAGLVMAISGNPKLEADYEIIHAHLEALHEKQVEPSAYVNAAISRCTQELLGDGGVSRFRRFWNRKRGEKETTTATIVNSANVRREVDQLIAAKDMATLYERFKNIVANIAMERAGEQNTRDLVETAIYIRNGMKIVADGGRASFPAGFNEMQKQLKDFEQTETAYAAKHGWTGIKKSWNVLRSKDAPQAATASRIAVRNY